MSATNHLIEINPNDVTESELQILSLLAGLDLKQKRTPQEAWEKIISKLPLSLIMAIIDGFHDFCKGGRVAGNVSNDEDVSDDISDIVKIAYFRQAEKLLRVQLKKIGTQTPTDNINDMIAAMTNEKVGSMSNYERRIVKAIESRPELASVLGQTRKSYSIQEIVNAPNSDNSENEDGKTGRPQLWKEICGEVVTVPKTQEADRNAEIAAGPALYDKSLYLYWDPEYQLAQEYWRKGKDGHNALTNSYQAYDPIFLKRLGSFIYTYLYPELSWSDDEENKTAIVFDMASGCLGKIFGAFDNGFVTSDICPQTVSDSAGTSENQIKSLKKGSLNRYNFCETEDIKDQDRIESGLIAILNAIGGGPQKFYKAQGNVLTWKYNTDDNKIIHTRIIYAIGQGDEYTQSTYCYFKVYICTRIETDEGLSNWAVNQLNFNIIEKNGPSVAYLSSLVYALENPDPGTALPNPPLKKAMINITPVIQHMRSVLGFPRHFLQALLFDFKRCGDWEQSRSAQLQNKSSKKHLDNYQRVLFGTGDILCVTYNRECRGNSMWHYEGPGGAVGWNIVLHRNPNITKSLAKEIADALEVVRKSTTIEKMLDRICHSSDFMKRIRALKELVGQHGHKAVYYYNGNKAATENKIESRIEKLITMICRIGMKDIYFKCEVFERLLASPDNILKSIVGSNIQGNVCMTVTNYYLMGLNYLRDIFTKMNVKSKDAAIRFLNFVNAPNKNDPSYFTQEINASIPQLNNETDFTNNFISPTDDYTELLNMAKEDSGIAAIILAKRIIFNDGYNSDPQDKKDEFLAIYEWLDEARKQLSDNGFSINRLVTKYADSINGASPESDFKKALDLIREIKTTTIKNILPDQGVQAATATDPSGYKKTTINHILQLGEVDPIFQLNPQDDNTWVFNKAFGAKSSLGAFKFRIKDMKKLADYLKLMYYKGFKIRARFGTTQTQNNNRLLQGEVKKPTDDWTMFSTMVKQTIPTLTNPTPPYMIGWTKEQMMGNSFRNYVSREVESAWPKLRKENEDSEYGKVLQDFTDFDCPALYRIVRDGTIVRSYVVNNDEERYKYCQSIYCGPNGKPYVEGLNISRLARKKYNLDQDGLDPGTKINIVAEEIESFSRWLTILLDIQNDGTGLSPFSVNNLQERAAFLGTLTGNIAEAAKAENKKAKDLINEMGELDDFAGDKNIEKFENMMYIAVNSIGYVNAGPPGPQPPQQVLSDGDLEGGAKKMQKGGAVPSLAKQKQIQLTMLSYLFLNMSGKARALINPLTDPRQLLVILQKMEFIGNKISNQGFVNNVKNSAAYKVLNSGGTLTYTNLNMNSSQATFELLSLYSNMIHFYGDDYDFLGTYKVFDDIKYNFIASINSEMSPLTDEQGNPYDGYNFKLLDAVLKIFIMINNLHIRDPKGQIIKQPYTPPTINFPETTDTDNEVMSDAPGSIEGGGKKRKFDDDDDINNQQRTKIQRKTIRERYLDNIENNIDLLEGLNNSIISENEQNDINTYFNNPDPQKKVEEYNNWLIENANSIGFNISALSPTQSQIVSKLLYLILKSKLETRPPAADGLLPPNGDIKRELDEMLKYTIPYSQSIKPDPTMTTQYFILPHIKLLLAFSAIQSFLPAKTDKRSKDPLFMLFFQNPSALPTDVGIDFAWNKWQDNTIINSIYQILYKLLLFEEQGVYTPVNNVFMGGKKNKTRKKRKKNRKTRKASKKQRKKNRKTRGKGNKRKGKKRRTRGRKKKN